MSQYELVEEGARHFKVLKDGQHAYNLRFKSSAWSCDCPARKECKHLRMLPVEYQVKRFPREEITKAIKLLRPLLPSTFCVCGSYRRDKIYCKDMDILVLCSPDEFTRIKETIPHAIGGDKKIAGEFNGIPFDLEWVCRKEWASHLLYRTGSKELNIKMRQAAKAKGWVLNEHGIQKPEGMRHYLDERDIFEDLDMMYLPPVDRG